MPAWTRRAAAARRAPPGARLHLSGCPKGCARPAGPAVHIEGAREHVAARLRGEERGDRRDLGAVQLLLQGQVLRVVAEQLLDAIQIQAGDDEMRLLHWVFLING